MGSPFADSFPPIIERVDEIFNRRLTEALRKIEADIEAMKLDYPPEAVIQALIVALLQAKVTPR